MMRAGGLLCGKGMDTLDDDSEKVLIEGENGLRSAASCKSLSASCHRHA